LTKVAKIFISVFMMTVLLLGFSSNIGKQFLSAYGQSDEDSTDNDIQDEPISESIESSFVEDNFTVVTPSNFSNQTIIDLNQTRIGEASQEDVSVEDTAIPDEVTSETLEGQQQTDTPIQTEEDINQDIPISKDVTQEKAEVLEDQDLQNFTDIASNLSEAEISTNLTQSSDSAINATDTEDTNVVQQEQGQETSTETGNDTQGAPELQAQDNVTTIIPNNIGNGTNETSVTEDVSEVDLLSANDTEDLPLAPEAETVDNVTDEAPISGSVNASAQVPTSAETLAQIIPAEEILGNQTSEEIDAAASDIVGITNATSTIENNQVSNIQNVMNSIALSSGQSGGNPQQIVAQISKEIVANPKGPVAKAIQTLAGEYTKGNSDEINIAAKQIGTLIAKGNNIQQTLVQVTNKVVNNIQNIKTSIENYDKVVVNPKISSKDKDVIQQTINVIKKSKTEVDVPRVHIKFHTHERNLVLRILSTTNYKYEMPFSKYNGAFKLDDNEFRVKILSGDGVIQSASVAKMFKSGKVGDRVFLDKDVRKGKVFFSLDDINDGRYLLEVYVKLSNGSIGTFARGSVSIR
jgi:hypothetical protein